MLVYLNQDVELPVEFRSSLALKGCVQSKTIQCVFEGKGKTMHLETKGTGVGNVYCKNETWI